MKKVLGSLLLLSALTGWGQTIYTPPLAWQGYMRTNEPGTVTSTNVPPGVLTNGQADVTLTGTFTGNGASITNLSGANIQAGTINSNAIEPALDELYRAGIQNGSDATLSSILLTNPATAFKAGFSVITNGTNLTFRLDTGASGTVGTYFSLSNGVANLNATTIDLGNNAGAYFRLEANAISDVGNAGLKWLSRGPTGHIDLTNANGRTFITNGFVMARSFVVSTNTAEPPSVAGAAQFYSLSVSGTAEMFVQGSDGTETQISSHPSDAPLALYDTNRFELEQHIIREVNPFVTNGVVRWVNTTRMARLTEINSKAILFLAGKTSSGNSNSLERLKAMSNNERQCIIAETFAEYNARTGGNLQPLVWETVESQRQAAYDAERDLIAQEVVRITAENEAKIAAGDTNLVDVPIVPPEADVRRPKPTWMRQRPNAERFGAE